MQWAMYLACPYGERRADMRAAHTTAQLILSQAANADKLTEDQYRDMVASLSQYLKCEQPRDGEEADLAALALMQRGGV